MTILWLTLLTVYAFAFFARYFSVPDPLGPALVRPNRLLAIGVAAVLVAVAGLRNNIGDTFFYMHAFEVNDFSWYSILKEKDIGFGIFQKVLKSYTDDPQALVFIIALVTDIFIVLALYRYSRMFEVAVYVFITSGAFIVSMNGMRQYLAAALLFWATKYLLTNSWKRYMLIVLFASIFHQSALIMVPIYFLVRRKAWTRSTFILLALAILIVFGFNQFQGLLFAALQDTSYGEYQNFQEGGANLIRVIFYIVPLVIAYIGREKLRALNPRIDIFVNMSLIGAALMIIATQNWIFARMAIYFSLYQIVLVSWIIKVFRWKDQKLVYFVLVAIYFLYFFYENVITLNIQYRSDYITWFS
ncbi:EpsG family protein [Cohnella sp. OV330]|uniref:EpsG family protein n=1 Tax=Cohnella sp. OV330 TaxID=1855288 RepID=UPI0008E10FD6|nr:EpsG family protein [Cohnella sp. OV330]SFB29993.1 EpsG family protein [Cohnella sp. OV330]